MKVLLITQDDPFYLKFFFNAFSRELEKLGNVQVEGIAIQAPLGSNDTGKLLKKVYGLYGFFGLIAKGTQFVYLKCMNLLAVRVFKGKLPGCYSLEHLGLRKSWPILNNVNVNSKAFIEDVVNREIDLIVSVGGSQKFKTKILNTPRYGCINVHNSKLPKLRGMLPTFWAMMDYENDPTTAVSIFKMDEDWDSGPLVLQQEVQLSTDEPLERLIKRTKTLGGELMAKVLGQYAEHGEPELLKNDPEKATYKTFPTIAEVKEFRKRGYRIL